MEAAILPARGDRRIGSSFHRLAQAQHEGKYQIYACAIMPDHVHIVLRCPSRTLGITIGHFKAQATRSLNEVGISPCPNAAAGQDQPAVWGERK